MDLIKTSEIVKYQFYTMPKELFINCKYKKLSIEAKMIYTLFIDRLELSKKNGWVSQDAEYFRASNTNINKTNKSYTKISQSVEMEELEEIKKRCELYLLEETDNYGNNNTQIRDMVENAIELMYYSDSIKVGNAIIPQSLVRNRLKQLNGAKIFYALEKLKNNLGNTQNFVNITKYLMSCFYNAINEYKSDAEVQYAIDTN